MKYLFTLFLISAQSFASNVPQIQVNGTCEMKVTPDRGMITFTAENQSKTQKPAVDKTVSQINKLKELIKTLKLQDLELKNSNYSVTPVREWEKEKMVDKGYRATFSLEVTTSEISRIGEAMMKGSEAGIVNVGSLFTFLSLEKSQAEYLKCLDIAAGDAKSKARQLAKKLGFEVGPVISVFEGAVTQPEPVMIRTMEKSMSMDSAQSSPSVEAGTQKYSTNIQVTFSIK